MTSPAAGNSGILSAIPTPSQISEMIDALDAVDLRLELIDHERWIAEGVEAASERSACDAWR